VNVIFLSYRDWALRVVSSVSKHAKISTFLVCKTHEELVQLDLQKFDLIISIGWSEELGEKVASNISAIGVHCAELDRYSYGTPIQLQIMDGITRTKHRVFSFTYDPNSYRAHTHNRLYSHEVDLDLSGNMADILLQMEKTSVVLFNRFLDDFPKIKWKEWPEEKIVRFKRTPKDSLLTKEDLLKMNTNDLYNFFRALEDPYPNGYIEDKFGRLYIQKVRYESNRKKN